MKAFRSREFFRWILEICLINESIAFNCETLNVKNIETIIYYLLRTKALTE